MSQTVATEKHRPTPPRLFWLLAALAYLCLFTPLLCVITYSFLVPTDDGLRFGWDWYERLYNNDAVWEALQQSLALAFSSATLSVLLGLGGTLAIGRQPGFWGRCLAKLCLTPLVMPEVVLGVSALLWFATLGWELGFSSMLATHVTLCLAYALATLHARFCALDPALDEAARDLGASPRQVLWRVILPQLSPSLAAAFLMALTISFDDFLLSFFTAGTGTDTLPLKLYGMIKFGKQSEIYALSTLLLISSTACLGGFFALRRNAARRRFLF